MYNSAQKERYIEWARKNRYEEESIKLLIKIFEATAFEEEKVFDKDVSEFIDEEVYDLLLSFNSKSRARLQSDCVYLSGYYSWCKNIEHMPISFEDPFDKRIVNTIIDKILPKHELNDKYFNKETFEEYKNCIPDVTNKFIFECFFRGIKGKDFKEIIFMKLRNIDENNLTVKLFGGRQINIDSQFIKLAKEANLSEYYYKDGFPIENKFNTYKYAESEYILKACGQNRRTDYITKSVIESRFRIMKQQTGNEFISSSVLYTNGMINYIKEKYAEKNIELKSAILDTGNDPKTQSYIKEFGASKNVRMLRMEIKDYLHLL